MPSEADLRRAAEWAATQPCANNMIACKRGDWCFVDGGLSADAAEGNSLRLYLTPAGSWVHVVLSGARSELKWGARLPKDLQP